MAGYGQNPYAKGRQVPLSNINPGYEEPQFSDMFDNRHLESGAGPGIPLETRGGAAAGYQDSESSQDMRQRSQWAKDGQRDTAILLESLPSKQLERMASEIAHNSSWRKKSTQRKSLHGPFHIPSGRDVSDDLIRSCDDDPDLADELEDEIKGMTMTMSQKRKLKSQVSLKRKKPKMVSRWKRFKYNIGIKMKHLKYNLAEFLSFFNLWTGHLKKIEGHFGTGVLSYFLFLKWLFFINVPIFILSFSFVILPQILYRHLAPEGHGYSQNVSFTGEELLTGAGWFEDTELYYGHYTSETINLLGDSYYNMKYAYLFTCGGYYILCLIILAISISKSYKKNYIEGSGAYNFYNVTRIFCGWDYGITAKESAKLKQKSICNEFKEYLSGIKEEEEKKTLGEFCKWFLIRLLTNLIILGLIGGSGYLIYYIQEAVSVTIPILSEMAMPLCVSGVNLILPFVFSLIARQENYVKPKHELYINMLRTMVLKAVTLGVLIVFWYRKMDDKDPVCVQGSQLCCETFIGQQIYRLMIVDFLFILFTTFFLEFIRRFIKDICIPSLASPEFDIGRNTLNLIYSQALCWLGTYFAPMVSLIAIIKLFLLFYVKRVSVIQNCKPSLRPWRASRSHTIFLGFLFFFFLLCTAAVTYAVIFLTPCTTSGPFKNHTSSYEIVVDLVDGWKDRYNLLHEIIQVISSSGFIAGTLVVLVVVTYYMRIVMVGHKEMVELLRQQLSMEGRDKAYLLKMLQDANKRYRGTGRPTTAGRSLSPPVGANVIGDSVSPGGRTFIKQMADTQRSTDLTPQRPRRNRQNASGAAGTAM